MSDLRDVAAGAIPFVDDPLADALGSLRMDGMFYCPSELTAPWGVDMPHMDGCLWFHVVTSGACTMRDASGAEHAVRRGDVIVFPHGGGHTAYDRPHVATPVVFDLPHQYLSDQYAIMRHGGGGELTTLTCGVLRFGDPAAKNLIAMLPEMIHVQTADDPENWQWFPWLLSLMGTETRAPKPGGEAVVTRLCDILVIQTIRSWIDTAPEAQHGWIGALRDPVVGQAIAMIHKDPARAWTVEELGNEVAMSRSGFSSRFTDMVGESPKQYVTRWRMQVAEERLRTTDASILEIASSLGYGSEAAFSRAFKRVVGVPPSQLRQKP